MPGFDPTYDNQTNARRVEIIGNNTAPGGYSQVQGNVPSGTSDTGDPIKIAGVYNATKPTVTTGQRVDAQSDPNGNLYTREAYALGLNTDNLLAYTAGFSYATITTATTTTIMPSNGIVGKIKVLGGTLGAVTVYDNTAASGTLVVPAVTPTQGQEIAEQVKVNTGITIVTAAATILLITYRLGN